MSRRAGVLLRVVAVLVSGVLAVLPAPSLAMWSPVGQHTGRVWASISAGDEHTCGIRLDGSLWCWGYNGYGELGTGGKPGIAWVPKRVGDAAWSQVDASDNGHTCGVRVDGSLWCWGNNQMGQLGTGDFDARLVPTQVEGAAEWTAVSTGYGHTCAIRVDGSLWCWGLNNGGQLGTGSDKDMVPDPTEVTAPSGWLSMTAGAYHTCGIQLDHSLWCWGAGGEGQTGIGDRRDHNVPVEVGTHADWLDVSAGYAFTCGVRAAHTLWCWGYNFSGQLGVGDRASRYVPTRLGGRFWAQVSSGAIHACARSTDGGLFCWGEGHDGRLGYGGVADLLVPLRIGTRSDWLLLTAGGFHTCAIRTSHGLLCWGWNLRGQLGVGRQVKHALYPRVV
jgi:alpha-tubulin suppressor-like RCC1 family protein